MRSGEVRRTPEVREDGAEHHRRGDLDVPGLEVDLPLLHRLEVELEHHLFAVYHEEQGALIEEKIYARGALLRPVEDDHQAGFVVPIFPIGNGGVKAEDGPTTRAFPGGHEVVVATLLPHHVDAPELKSKSHEIGDVEKTLTADDGHDDPPRMSANRRLLVWSLDDRKHYHKCQKKQERATSKRVLA